MVIRGPSNASLSKRKSLSDDLIIWHGITAQNLSIAVKNGLPFDVRRRKIWIDVVNTEIQKSKDVVSQSFAFLNHQNSSRPLGTTDLRSSNQSLHTSIHTSAEEDGSSQYSPIETRVADVIASLTNTLPVTIDSSNSAIIEHLARVIIFQMRVNSEANKLLSFIIYREQSPTNRRPCIPCGSESYAIYQDVLETCINARLNSVYKHLQKLQLSREVVWSLFHVCMSEAMPMELRVRFVDNVLVRGCHVLVSAMIAFLAWREEAILKCNTSDELFDLLSQKAHAWLNEQDVESFWKKCVEMHDHSFLHTYANTVRIMRLKAVAMGCQRHVASPVIKQMQEVVFTYEKYSWIGFDVDHTLCEYRLPYLLKASFKAACKQLQQEFVGLRAMALPPWNQDIAQRGIAIDTTRGNFLHLSEQGTILKAYHGTSEMSYYSIRALYRRFGSQDITTSSSPKIVYMYTAAEIVFAPCYAWLVDSFDTGCIAIEEMGASLYLVPDTQDYDDDNPNDPFLANRLVYISLSNFALKAARKYYADGFWKTIRMNPELILQPNPDIRTTLEFLKDKGVKLFLLTNSSHTHVNEVMKFCIGKDWNSFFSLILTEAKKEIFFDDLNDTAFQEVESFGNFRAGSSCSPEFTRLKEGSVYALGNIRALEDFFKSRTMVSSRPQRVCYFGDHLLQDTLLVQKRETGWDLVSVIKEMNFLNQVAEPETTTWFSMLRQLFTSRVDVVIPDIYSSFFFVGMNGRPTYFGKLICNATIMSVPSVGKLARHNCVLKVIHFQQGHARLSTKQDLNTLTRRFTERLKAFARL